MIEMTALLLLLTTSLAYGNNIPHTITYIAFLHDDHLLNWPLPLLSFAIFLQVSVPVDLYLLKPTAFQQKAASGTGVAAVAARSGIKLL